MKTIELTYPQQLDKQKLPETVAAIGFFDGIHRGHKKVIQTAINKANEQGKMSAVITFFPHPSVVLRKGVQHVDYLTPLQEKQEILSSMGVDTLYILTFNEELSKVSPQDFVDHFIIGLHIKHLVAGFDFSYGHMGKGSMDTIAMHAKGRFDYTMVEKIEEDGKKMSSTLIRDYLTNGEVQKANHLLGRPLTARGTVVEGDKRGRTIGFPTANVSLSDNFFLPRIGIYAVTVKHGKQTYNGMASLGYNPTFNKEFTKPSLEVNIFDYNQTIYGEELIVEWRLYVRDEKKFNGVEELVSEMKQDEQVIRAYLTTN